LSQNLFFGSRAPVPATEIRVESVGVRAIDLRRVDVAVDLTPCIEPVRVELAIVGPGDDELAATSLLRNRDWRLDRFVHLRQDAGPGEYTLHVGVFVEGELVSRAARRFSFPQAEAE
jgi:hypothetical protein